MELKHKLAPVYFWTYLLLPYDYNSGSPRLRVYVTLTAKNMQKNPLDPDCVRPGKPPGIRARLRPWGLHVLSSCPVSPPYTLRYLQCVWVSQLIGWAAWAEGGTLAWQWLRRKIRPGPPHPCVVNLVWRSLIPEAELKSMLTLPALSLSHYI